MNFIWSIGYIPDHFRNGQLMCVWAVRLVSKDIAMSVVSGARRAYKSHSGGAKLAVNNTALNTIQDAIRQM